MSTNVRFFLSYDIKIILKSSFGVKTLGFCHMCDVKSIISYKQIKLEYRGET